MLLDSSRREVILGAFRAGARGILSRHESVETLQKCIHSVYQGQIWANSQQMAFAVEALASFPSVCAVDANGLDLLSKREMDVVRSSGGRIDQSRDCRAFGVESAHDQELSVSCFRQTGRI